MPEPKRTRAPGAGRKKLGTGAHRVNVSLSPEDHAAFKMLGGSKWLRGQLDATKKTQNALDKPSKETEPVQQADFKDTGETK